MKLNKNLFCSLWIFWFVITALYLLTFVGGGVEGNWNYGINNILGFFTPMGLGNLAGSFDRSTKWVITLPLLFLVLFIGNFIGRKFLNSVLVRIVYNLIILILLTMAMDLIIWQHWVSFTNFISIFH